MDYEKAHFLKWNYFNITYKILTVPLINDPNT